MVKTQRIDPQEVRAELEMSNRVALLERRLIDVGGRIDEMYISFLESRQRENVLSRELAETTQQRLSTSIQGLLEKRDEIRSQRVNAENKTELLMLNMMEDDIEARIERTRADLDRAKLVIEKTEKAISESNTNIKAVKDGKPSTPAQPLKFGSWLWFQDKFITNGLQVVWIALLLAFMQIGIIPLFQFLLQLLNKAFGGE